jgi:hypothetical protein
MTSMYEAQLAVVTEVKNRILALAPEYEEQIRFSVRDEKMRALADMDEDTGRPRLFEIGEAVFQEATYVGCATRGMKYSHKIFIMYPHDETWSMGMISDSELIRYDLLNNATAASGIQQRYIDTTGEITITKDDDDPWQTLEMDMIVHYEIS